MIPRIIHYCWFGGSIKPEKAAKCIDTWKRICSDYKIIEWNETNVDLSECPPYIQEAYKAKKYAYVSDFIRLKVLYEYGGFYMDTDVELLKSLDQFTDDKAVIGFENDRFINSGQLFGAVIKHPILYEMMKRYDHLSFYNDDGSMFLLGCPHVNTEILVNHGLIKNGTEQIVADVHVYPAEWFNPLDSATGILQKTKNTVSIHWYSMSWISPLKRIRVKIMRVIRRGIKFLGLKK